MSSIRADSVSSPNKNSADQTLFGVQARRSGCYQTCAVDVLFVFQVVCTGKEESILDCDFPQDFGADYGFDYYGGGYNENWPAPAHAAPEPAPMENAPAPSGGLPNSNCARDDSRRLSVICRRFEITGAFLSVHCVAFAGVPR